MEKRKIWHITQIFAVFHFQVWVQIKKLNKITYLNLQELLYHKIYLLAVNLIQLKLKKIL